MTQVSSSLTELTSRINTISSANNSGKNSLNPVTTSCSSTTKLPKNESVIIPKLLQAMETLYNKLDKELSSIQAVGDNFVTMDNFLADESLDLGFEITSKGVQVEPLSSFASESISELLNKNVPIVQGYNDADTLNGKKSSGVKTGGDYDEGGHTYPGSIPSSETPAKTTTEPVTNPVTEAPTEALTEAVTEAMTEMQTEAATEAITEMQTEALTEAISEAPTTVSEPKNDSSSNKNASTNNTIYYEKKEEPVIPVTEPVVEEPVIEEPPVEEYVEPEITITEPFIEEPVIEEPQIVEPITIEGNTVTPTKNNNTGKVVGTIAGVGLAAGAAAVGYGMYKKSKENEEESDYGYEDGGVY